MGTRSSICWLAQVLSLWTLNPTPDPRACLITLSAVELNEDTVHDLLAGPGAPVDADVHLTNMSRLLSRQALLLWRRSAAPSCAHSQSRGLSQT